MGKRLNILLIVIDSLRASSLREHAGRPHTPFLTELANNSVHFDRAHATECWTLPTHMSVFTGLLPSEHRAHFHTMSYAGTEPTLAELLAARGYATEVVTRNSLLDGTVPGVTRGFLRNSRILAETRRGPHPLALLTGLAKPRLRRVMRQSGFFHLLQRQSRDFITTLARMGLPADARVLDHALERMDAYRRARTPYFLFLNLYDVHAPYCPSPNSPLRPFSSAAGIIENLMLPWVLPRISSHAYLRTGFRLSAYSRRMLLARYHRAIELMDEKLGRFYREARDGHFLDNTLLIVTSDHGEAFGEHGLYFHDASVFETHLHVPLWIKHPNVAPAASYDVLSTARLFELIRSVGDGSGLGGTILDPTARTESPYALAEHFHYPHGERTRADYRQDIAAALVWPAKAIIRPDGLRIYDAESDPGELLPDRGSIADFEAICRRNGAPASAIDAAIAHLRRWENHYQTAYRSAA